MSEVLGRICRLPASTPDKIGTITRKPANMSEAVGNISGVPEKMSGNSDHPPAFPSGRPEHFAGISARRLNGVEHQRFSAAGEGRTGVIATGVIGECRQLSGNGGAVARRKFRLGSSNGVGDWSDPISHMSI
jgi:hypothetical protein